MIDEVKHCSGNSLHKLNGNGDYKSDECLAILKSCDVVVTNPPFSLFREFIITLFEYKKEFIILGNGMSILCKEIFPHIINNELWFGKSITKGDREFSVPRDFQIDGKMGRQDTLGNKFIRVRNVRWFTNINYTGRFDKFIILSKSYNEKDYPKYDNYNAINVDRTKNIPKDYTGLIGVPTSFFDNYNPEQFQILGITCRGLSPQYQSKIYTQDEYENFNDLNGCACLLVNGKPKCLFARLLIKKVEPL